MVERRYFGQNWRRKETTTLFGHVLDMILDRRGKRDVGKLTKNGTISRWRRGERFPERDAIAELVTALFPIDESESDMLYIAAGFTPPGWQKAMLRKLCRESGHSVDRINDFKGV